MFANNPLISLFRKVWQQAAGNRRNVVLYVSMFLCGYGIMSLEPLILGLFLNTVQDQGVSRANLLYLLGLLLLFPLKEIGMWMFHGPARIIENRNAFFVRARYKQYLLAGTLGLPMEWHADHHSGDTIDKIEKGTTALSDFSENTFQILSTAISMLVALGVMLYFSLLSGAIAIGTIIITFSIIFRFDQVLIPGYRRINRMENQVTAKIFDSLSNVTTVIILRVGAQVLSSIKSFIAKPFAEFDRTNKINEWKWFTAAIMGRIAVFLIVAAYMASQTLAGETVMVGTIYIIYGYAREIRESFFQFSGQYSDIVRRRTSVANAEELSKDFRTNHLPGKNHLPKRWSVLEIRNLSFSYHTDEGADLHLDDIALRMAKGERIALIGESGGGKSTFLKVLRDLYHPKALELSVDGKSVKGFSAISDSISLIPQDPEIFATTIRENITLGVEHDDREISRFTDMACFSPIVAELPHGLDSSIVEKGVNLSGGEKQRLALARGLLASMDKDIILLDEPTSSVDFHNELSIYQNIFAAFPAQTIISSIHRLHLLALFDTVHFFQNGRIIASGPVEELKRSSREFRNLWRKYSSTRDAER